MDNITCVEIICDLLEESERLNFNKNMIEALCKARYETMCKHSPIQAYKCQVEIHFSSLTGLNPICVDTCLQAEIHDLIRKHKIWTIGSCCGHGTHRPYLQVNDHSVPKMLELGYEQLPVDKYGNGKNCFKPKTILYNNELSDNSR